MPDTKSIRYNKNITENSCKEMPVCYTCFVGAAQGSTGKAAPLAKWQDHSSGAASRSVQVSSAKGSFTKNTPTFSLTLSKGIKMAKSTKAVKNVTKSTKAAKAAPVAVAAPVAPVAPPVAATPAKAAARVRLPLQQAIAHNKANVFAADGKVVAANVALTAKGTNKSKQKVYGYDNWASGNGRVPVSAQVAIVPGAVLPKAVNAGQWEKLQELVAKGTKLVTALYDAGVTSRTIRRAYRAGAIRFVQIAA